MFDFFKVRNAKLGWNELQSADDAVLMEQLKSGNDDAFAVIVDRYRRLVFSVAIRIVKNESEAEEVAQAVLMEVYRKVEQFSASRGTLKMWLLQYAYSRSINRRHYLEERQFYSKIDLEEADPIIRTANSISMRGLSSIETGLLVRRALGELSAKQQEMIELVYFKGLTLKEAAEKTGETMSVVSHNYYRGLLKMREIIEQRPRAELDRNAEVGMMEVQNFKPRPV